MTIRPESTVGAAIRRIVVTGGEADRLTGIEDDPLCNALAAIADERAYQDTIWGAENDDKHSDAEWLNIIEDRFWHAADRGNTPQLRERLMEIAAVCVAAIERIDTGKLT